MSDGVALRVEWRCMRCGLEGASTNDGEAVSLDALQEMVWDLHRNVKPACDEDWEIGDLTIMVSAVFASTIREAPAHG